MRRICRLSTEPGFPPITTRLRIAAWVAVAAVAAFLRLNDLSHRPFHADEATGALITAKRMTERGYVFDPLHFHGPTLSVAGMVGARLHRMHGWAELEKDALRAEPVLAGCLVALAPLLGRRRFGDGPMLLAALALATSPLLVYYSRMYIHEMLLALFGVLALFQFASAKRWWPAGIWIGLMFATKETFAISMLAWTAAAGLLYTIAAWRGQAPGPVALLAHQWRPALVAGTLALLVALLFYTNGFSRWQGAADAARTFFVYDVVKGHDKPWPYYFRVLLQPLETGGGWWFETAVAVLALAALAGGLTSRTLPRTPRLAIGFLSLSAVFHFLIYTAFAYKTPWLMVLPWAHVCLLAGFVVVLPLRGPIPRVVLALALAAVFASQFVQSRRATGELASDDRNPYAYVPTSTDIETLPAWLTGLKQAVPGLALEPIPVVGTGIWPLPWYLRKSGPLALHREAPADLASRPLVLATIDLTDVLGATHMPERRPLRTDAPVVVWMRFDLWEASLAVPSP